MALAGLLERARAEAGDWDRVGALPADVVRDVAALGLLGSDVPSRYGGLGRDARELGELCAALGGACSSLRSLVTVQGMVGAALLRWGTEAQRAAWLPALASGALRAGFAATEQGAGTELAAVATEFTRQGGEIVVSGRKLWITFGRFADVFLVLGRYPDGLGAVLVEADRAGVRVEPVHGQLGLRAGGLADVTFDQVRIPAENALATKGFGLSHVVGTALDHGRFTVAWGCVGIAEECLALAARHAATRVQGTTRLVEHQVVRAALGRMLVETESARALCERAADDRGSIPRTVTAKYAAARAAAHVSTQAVQVLGAAGCADGAAVARFFRDAKVMQIIEGADEVAEVAIGEHAVRRHLLEGDRPCT
ncbi:acyl-CoA dehydrogenase family protein [Actinokineospora sp. NBRC 105648]|uniref:acyl-CoA dehydrogenase family protein n=1 Tax=Actinokineospora sp. NBRC 105648 TaxID=3032206 RepID=UPI0024A2A5BA|nr:acyl-CoA dehydrogenase family protein [Actinokineospora sp. NBRC 105648]GLZ40299.1 acyl-CoA dehydrogenase [Actinokineospora sp. NBRC 105648]